MECFQIMFDYFTFKVIYNYELQRIKWLIKCVLQRPDQVTIKRESAKGIKNWRFTSFGTIAIRCI